MATSDSTSSPKYCYVYLVQSESGAVKIGISNNVRQRLRELQTGNHEQLSLAYCLRLANRETALMLESALHARYPNNRLRGEWFSENAAQVIDDIRFAVAVCRIVTAIEYVEFVMADPFTAQPAQQQVTLEKGIEDVPRIVSQAIRDDDEFVYIQAVDLVRRLNRASISLLQRRMKIGYERASRIIDLMYERGVIGEETGNASPRKVL